MLVETPHNIKLSKPIMTHGGSISYVGLREPSGLDYLRLGEPLTYVRNPDGVIFSVEREDVIEKYVATCVVGVGEEHFGQFSLADAMKIKAAVLDFFPGRAGASVGGVLDLLVFDLKLIEPRAAGCMTFSELFLWADRAAQWLRREGVRSKK